MSYRADEFSQLSKRMPFHGKAPVIRYPSAIFVARGFRFLEKMCELCKVIHLPTTNFLHGSSIFFQHGCTGVIVHRLFYPGVERQVFIRTAVKAAYFLSLNLLSDAGDRTGYSGVLLDSPGCSHTYLGTPKPENWARNN